MELGNINSNVEFDCSLIGKLIGADLNTTSDQTISILDANAYIIDKIIITNSSLNLAASLTAGGFYSGVNKTGFTIVNASQLYTTLTSPTKFSVLTLALTSDVSVVQTIYFSLTTPHGSAATCDVYVYGYKLS